MIYHTARLNIFEDPRRVTFFIKKFPLPFLLLFYIKNIETSSESKMELLA